MKRIEEEYEKEILEIEKDAEIQIQRLEEEKKKLAHEYAETLRRDIEKEEARERKFKEDEENIRLSEEALAKEKEKTEALAVLRVASDANAKEIRSAFLKLSMKLHPDKNKDPNAAAMFNNVKTAYDILTGRAETLSEQTSD